MTPLRWCCCCSSRSRQARLLPASGRAPKIPDAGRSRAQARSRCSGCSHDSASRTVKARSGLDRSSRTYPPSRCSVQVRCSTRCSCSRWCGVARRLTLSSEPWCHAPGCPRPRPRRRLTLPDRAVTSCWSTSWWARWPRGDRRSSWGSSSLGDASGCRRVTPGGRGLACTATARGPHDVPSPTQHPG